MCLSEQTWKSVIPVVGASDDIDARSKQDYVG